MSVPIWTSPGRSGVDPQLALSYDSGNGNGPFGFGWSLELPSITRRTDQGLGLPRYRDGEDSDVFFLSGADDLVPVLDDAGQVVDDVATEGFAVRRFRPRVETLFARIERWTRSSDGDVHWRSISRDNVLTVYGADGASRIADPLDRTRVFSWLVCESRDALGNATRYDYKSEDGAGADRSHPHERHRGPEDDARRTANRFPKRIRYGNRAPLLDEAGRRPFTLTPAEIDGAGWMFEVVFDYGEHGLDTPTPAEGGSWTHRVDAFSTYRAGFEVRTGRACRRVLMFHHFEDEPGVGADCLVRSTDLQYAEPDEAAGATVAGYLFLRAVTHAGYQRRDGSYLRSGMPPVEFEYTRAVVQDAVRDVDAESLRNLPVGIDGTAYRWTDLHGEGIPGVLTEHDGTWYYTRNISPISGRHVEFSAVTQVANVPGAASSAAVESRFMDLAGDGRGDLVVLGGPVTGFHEHDGADGWLPFRPFDSRINRVLTDPGVRFVDLDGDGRADVLISEDDALVWHASIGEQGWGPANRVPFGVDDEAGPRPLVADATEAIHLADISGDGLADLVRIRNGEICYWPNLGHCRFGVKVTMSGAPHFDQPDQFDPSRILLADIDGTGTTDVVYLHRDGAHLYFNESGNGWSARRTVAVPRLDSVVAVTPADLLGNGTACLVWSSPLPGDAGRQVRYVDLMGHKPHLLTRIVNNLGSETRVAYASSTRFYLEDERDGRPWITRLPFPVHVVERVEVYDHISRNRFLTRYRYHHGFFDGEDREFRGFGMVEQWDTEEYAALRDGEAFPAVENIHAASHVPPIRTKSWFHTGVHLDRDRVSDHFAGLRDPADRGEYYREPGLDDLDARALLLTDTVLPGDLTSEEEREACRALKGSMLRQEVYALDATPAAEHPYTVTERNFGVRRLQPRAGAQPAVFCTHAQETLEYHYERDPTDPRVQHGITLDTDTFGNVLKDVSIGYGRRRSDPALPLAADRARQTTTLVTYTERGVTEAVADVARYPFDHRTPLRCDTRTFELTGYSPTGVGGRFQPSDLVVPDAADPLSVHLVFDGEVDYEGVPPAGRRRRMIEHVRTLYRPDDLGAAQDDPLRLLPLGALEPLALQGETYSLAFTPGLLANGWQRDGVALLPDPAAVLGGSGPGGYLRSQELRAPGPFPASDPDDHWWVRTGRVFLSPDTATTARQELAHARAHFFLTHRHRSPVHTAAASGESSVSYDVHDLLPVQTRDPVGNLMTVGERRADGTSNLTIPGNDYRVLQPLRLADANRNRTEVVFDALGMLVATAARGKPGENLGDSLDGVEANLDEPAVLAHLADPLAAPLALLGGATTRLVYDLFAYRRTKEGPDPQPVVVSTVSREAHVHDLDPDSRSSAQQSFAYSDGLGREIQRKMQAEPGPFAGGGPVADPRWVGTGWTIFNNKGKPVLRYEPFFAATHRFEFGVRTGVSPVRFYDPADRVVATIYPNHTYDKAVFHPWRQTRWDENDTVLDDPRSDDDVAGFVAAYFAELAGQAGDWRTWHAQRAGGALGGHEQVAATKAGAHARTPTAVHLDALGRPFLTITHNGFDADTAPRHLGTRVEMDIEGNRRVVRDAVTQNGQANGRVVVRHRYDMLGNVIHVAGMEAGRRWMLADVAGRPMLSWDSRGHAARTEFDALHRPTRHHVAGVDPADPTRELLIERLVYGEVHPQAEQRNLRGRLHLHLDQAGVATTDDHDFRGNVRGVTRRLAVQYREAINWGAVDAVLPPTGGTLDAPALQAALATRLEPDAFTSVTAFDALDRPVSVTPPHAPSLPASTLRPRYNAGNLLERVDAVLQGAQVGGAPAWTPFVVDVEYDAAGRRRRIGYGNGVTTSYDYDPLTFRMVALRTRRDPDGEMQDLRYTYDPVGNLVHVEDAAQQVRFFRNKRVEPSTDYTYDALYRLVEATGREHLGQVGAGPVPHSHAAAAPVPHPGDGNAMGTYVETYSYDAVGATLTTGHRGADPAHAGWTRTYDYAEPSELEPAVTGNRVSATSTGAGVERYRYDPHGNVTRLGHLGDGGPGPNLHWDHRDRLVRADLGGGGTAFYTYDGSGRRVRKVWEKSATLIEERICLHGFEVFRRRGGVGAVRFERETLKIIDGERDVAHVETRGLDTAGTDAGPAQLLRFLLGNHLGSSSLELDERAQVISYEEYTPYGSTSYRAVRSQVETPSRCRFAGKERDEETGLSYFGARYLAPWLGMWIAVDPALLAPPSSSSAEATSPDGGSSEVPAVPEGEAASPAIPGEPATAPRLQPYVFALANPVTLSDPDGAAPVKIGYIYTMRAEVNGQSVVYSGQTARELAQRLYKDKHKWSSIIKAKTTTIEAHEVKAELDVAKSGRGTLASAKKEALSAAEQVIVKRRRAEGGLKALNSIEAAEEANVLKWADRHAVRLGPRFTFRGGVKVGAFAGFMLLDVFMMYRDEKISRYVMAPYVFEDEHGAFTINEHDRGIFRQNHYYKNYKVGPMAGQRVRISEDEFDGLVEEGKLLWGHLDWAGDWVPGLLRRELPVVDYCTANPDMCA